MENKLLPVKAQVSGKSKIQISLETCKGKKKKKKRKRRKKKNKTKNIVISASVPSSPKKNIKCLDFHSTPISPVHPAACMTPPNSPIDIEIIDDGWLFI